jgi:fructosamine-3-kinase
LKIGIDSHAISLAISKKFESLFKNLPSILIEEKPSLLHGDLWNGNLIPDNNGSPCLIDPAVYYGNREIDLAMTQLFGGFTETFYKSYQNAFPLERGFQHRLEIYNLYPLLVHVNLFGQGYLSQVLSIINKLD